MRKVVLGVGISLDGYIARPDGSVDFLFMPKDYSMSAFFRRIDTGETELAIQAGQEPIDLLALALTLRVPLCV